MLAKASLSLLFLVAFGSNRISLAQDPPSQQQSVPAASDKEKPEKPKIRVNVLNVCSPSPAEQREIAAALQRIPKLPVFASDFEVSRGVSTTDEKAAALAAAASAQATPVSRRSQWVRVRREFTTQPVFSAVQYSFSVDEQNMLETLVFHVGDPKDLLEVAIEDEVSAVTTPAAMLAVNAPASRIKLERFGKSSVVLARCPSAPGSAASDQSAFEPLFHSAAAVIANYRDLLGARRLVPDELARIRSQRSAATKHGSPTVKSAATKKDKEVH